MSNLRIIFTKLWNTKRFQLWTRVKWNKYYSEFHLSNDAMGIQIRLNILFIDIYYTILNGDLTNSLPDRIIYDILDFLPRKIDYFERKTLLLLEDWNYKNSTKKRDVETLEKIAKRCRVPVEAMYYVLDVFEKFHKQEKWGKYVAKYKHEENKSFIRKQIKSLEYP